MVLSLMDYGGKPINGIIRDLPRVADIRGGPLYNNLTISRSQFARFLLYVIVSHERIKGKSFLARKDIKKKSENATLSVFYCCMLAPNEREQF